MRATRKTKTMTNYRVKAYFPNNRWERTFTSEASAKAWIESLREQYGRHVAFDLWTRDARAL